MYNPLDDFSFSDPFATWWPFLVAAVVGIITAIRSYIAGPQCPSKCTVTGKVTIITGGSSGIGLQVAIELLNRGSTVIIASRHPQVTYQIYQQLQIKNKIKDKSQWRVESLDLASPTSIRKFVDSINETSVDNLINNAGVWTDDFGKNDDGIETHFATNYLGHFLLTHLLHPKLRASGSGRVINTVAHVNLTCDFNLSDINNPAKFTKNMAFSRSKLALLFMTRTLATMWQGDNITVNAVNPGLVRGTNHKSNSLLSKSLYYKIMAAPTAWIITKTPQQASQTIIYLAVDKSLVNVTGRYFINCSEVDVPQSAKDHEVGRRLHKLSQRLVNIAD